MSKEKEPLIYAFTGEELAILASATNWLFGYVEGTGRTIPDHVANAAAIFAPDQTRIQRFDQ